jgi:hypothetical protein
MNYAVEMGSITMTPDFIKTFRYSKVDGRYAGTQVAWQSQKPTISI